MELRRFQGHTDAVTCVAFSPDGSRIVTGGRDRTARLWNVETGTVLRILQGHEDEVLAVAFSGDGRGVFTASREGTVRTWDAGSGSLLRTHSSGGLRFRAVSLLPRAERYAALHSERRQMSTISPRNRPLVAWTWPSGRTQR